MPFRKRCTPEKRVYAKNLRHHPTEAEAVLWSHLRKRQLGFIFHRQTVILGWIVDFYCPKAKLAVEVDGPYHDNSRKEYDYYRDLKMWEHGIVTLRIDSRSVERTPRAVVAWIKDHALDRWLKPASSYQVHYVYAGELKR
jgi:very-short-patch-repair endonuclease